MTISLLQALHPSLRGPRRNGGTHARPRLSQESEAGVCNNKNNSTSNHFFSSFSPPCEHEMTSASFASVLNLSSI